MGYNYDDLSLVTARGWVDLTAGAAESEVFTYDAAGNLTDGLSVFDINNRLTSFKNHAITYDADGNMTGAFLNGEECTLRFDAKNRLTNDGTARYFYNAEDVRIRSLENGTETLYTYNVNANLSQLLMTTTDNNVTKYVYGLGLIGEESGGSFKTYHFDYRGSTVAITNAAGGAPAGQTAKARRAFLKKRRSI